MFIIKYTEKGSYTSYLLILYDLIDNLNLTFKNLDIVTLSSSIILITYLKKNFDISILEFCGISKFSIFRSAIFFIIFISSFNIFLIQPLTSFGKKKLFEQLKIGSLSKNKIKLIDKVNENLNYIIYMKRDSNKYRDFLAIEERNKIRQNVIFAKKATLKDGQMWQLEEVYSFNLIDKDKKFNKNLNLETKIRQKNISNLEGKDISKLELFSFYQYLKIIYLNLKKDISISQFNLIEISVVHFFSSIFFCICNFLIALYFNSEKRRNSNWINNLINTCISFVFVKNAIWFFESFAKKNTFASIILIPSILAIAVFILLIDIKDWQNRLFLIKRR